MLLSVMLLRFALTSAAPGVLALTMGAAVAQTPLATPALDDTLFKEGTVQLREFNSGSWYAKCQEIDKIKKRICNLLSTLPSHDGEANGSILIATTDTGVPAVLIALPQDIAKGRSISVKSSNLGKIDGKAVKVEYSTVAASTQCDGTCKYMFPLDPRLVFTLNAGESASVFVPAEEPTARGPVKKPKKPEVPLYTIPGSGFADALKASTQGW